MLVDGTGTDPRHRDLLHVGDEPGLAEALIHDKVPAAIAVQDDFDYVPPGASAQEASEYFVDERAAKILHGIGENHDLALVACMPPETSRASRSPGSAGASCCLCSSTGHRTSNSEWH